MFNEHKLETFYFCFFSVFVAFKSINSQANVAWVDVAIFKVNVNYANATIQCESLFKGGQLPIIKGRRVILDFKNWLLSISNGTDFRGR